VKYNFLHLPQLLQIIALVFRECPTKKVPLCLTLFLVAVVSFPLQ